MDLYDSFFLFMNQFNLNYTNKKEPPIGFSGDNMYLLPQGYQGKPCFLKYGPRKEIYEEGLIYQFLKDKIAVPEVYVNKNIDGINYLIVELVQGQMLSETFQTLTKKQTIDLYVDLLKQIHAIDYTDFPCCHDLKQKLERVGQIVRNNEVKTQYFERELQGKNPKDLYQYLLTHCDFKEDLVLCHGDVCFPNFIYDKTNLKAVIDVSGMGVNDYHLDIAIALRTLRYNFEMIGEKLLQEDINYFIACYNKPIDWDKITFYIILDELTNG